MFNLCEAEPQGHVFYNVSASDGLYYGAPRKRPLALSQPQFWTQEQGQAGGHREPLAQSQKPHVRPLPANRHGGLMKI